MGIVAILAIGTGVVFGAGKLFDALGTASAAKNLDTSFSGVKWRTPTGGRANFDVSVNHTNPTASKLTIENLDLKLSIAGFPVGTLKQATPQAIPANSTVKHTYRLQSEKWTNLTGTLFQMLLFGEIPDKITLIGSISANGFTTDLNTNLPLTK